MYVPKLVAGRWSVAVGRVITKGVRGHFHGTQGDGVRLPCSWVHDGKSVSMGQQGPHLI